LYFKVPAALALNGRRGVAARVLDWIGRHLLAADGTPKLAAEVERERPVNTYDRGWLAWGAALCERYDLQQALADDLTASQDRRTGGFWDSAAARSAQAGLQGAMTAGMAGLALLAAGRIEPARMAARFLDELWDGQASPDDGFDANQQVPADWDGRDGRAPPFYRERTSRHYVDLHGTAQRPARFGPAIALLVRLHRLTGDRVHLACARRYADLFLRRNELYLCVECHKYLWALCELLQLGPAEEYRAAAGACARYLIEAQEADGSWLPEASATGDGPSFELVLNTVGNVLAGLAYHLDYLNRA
ncbi:MAG: hypothetical protein OXC31_25145, partial [Spirochaetaceae bacterium]|nr:hypothetical protein [Spirochaetaceae bacterium]